MEIDGKQFATVFKAFCDENRIAILEQLQTGEKCACVLLGEGATMLSKCGVTDTNSNVAVEVQASVVPVLA